MSEIGTIVVYKEDEGYGFFEHRVFFHISQVPEEQRGFVAEGVSAEFTLQRGEKGIQAVNIRLVIETGDSGDYACIMVDEAGDWGPSESKKDRAIVAAFFPSDSTLTNLLCAPAGLPKDFHASKVKKGKRAETFKKMGKLVQELVSEEKASFAVGRIHGRQWPQGLTLGSELWAAMIVRLVAVYLPFVANVEKWALVAVEDRLVTSALWKTFISTLKLQLVEACWGLKRSDLAAIDTRLLPCIYDKSKGAVTHHHGRIPNHITPDFIRSGLSLPDFIGNVMVSGSSDEAEKWRKKLGPYVQEVDLTNFQLGGNDV